MDAVRNASARQERTARINRIARKLARHWKRLREKNGGPTFGKKPLARRERECRARKLIAYDLETTRINAGTPRPLYVTAFCDDWKFSCPIRSIEHFGMLLAAHFLTVERARCRYVAWNGNGFDVFFVARALLLDGRFELRPFLTRSKNVRGLKVSVKPQHLLDYLAGHKPPKGKKFPKSLNWEFLDGMAMTVAPAAVKLADFVKVFAPEFPKLDGPDFEAGEEFDPKNPAHVMYAERDSEGLYHAMVKAQSIVQEHFGFPLMPTNGNLGIKIFQANMPSGVQCWEPPLSVAEIIRSYVMRGGYCHSMRYHEGKIWKYDLNQAYPSAMRDVMLPAGRCAHLRKLSKYFRAAIYRVRARHPRGTIVPFYFIAADGSAQFSDREITDTWITSIEVEQLIKEGWILNVMEGYGWEDTFSMRVYVAKLEHLRMTAPDGPSGALGLMVKSIGNTCYGKTLESLDGMELLMSLERPEPTPKEIEEGEKRARWHAYMPDDEALENIWFRFREPQWREYHQPQIGSFITAHVRMTVRRAALLAPKSFLYADTDCVVFDAPVNLPIDPKRYGFWKQEENGTEPYWLITKKVYAKQNGDWNSAKHVRHAKGMNVKRLTREDFERWARAARGETGFHAPKQEQIQRANFVSFCAGGEMFKKRERRGQLAFSR